MSGGGKAGTEIEAARSVPAAKPQQQKRLIWCAGCGEYVHARLVTGGNIYPDNPALHHLPFWRCYDCGSYVGTHHKSNHDPLRPLGVLAHKQLRYARQHLHSLIDPVWKSGIVTRTALYLMISKEIGWKFHTAKTKSVEEARTIYRIVQQIRADLIAQENKE